MKLLYANQLVEPSKLIESFVRVTAKTSHSSNIYTTQYHKACRAGYVFCHWIDISKHLMLMVKPSQALVDEFARVLGYEITAIQPYELRGLNGAEESGAKLGDFNMVVSDTSRITSASVGIISDAKFATAMFDAKHFEYED